MKTRRPRLAAALLLLAGGCIPDVVPDVMTSTTSGTTSDTTSDTTSGTTSTSPPGRCEGLETGCGPAGDQDCCASKSIAGGDFKRLNSDMYPAHVSTFLLDRYEVTVGRFRQFVDGYLDHWPAEGAGQHPKIAGSGWDPAWDVLVPGDDSELLAEIGGCGTTFGTWTDAPGANEAMPMNCVSWYLAFAFCAWDGGRLPTESEWNYAAAGGQEQRAFPWGPASPDSIGVPFDCNVDLATCIGRVGATSPGSDGRFGQADLGGNMGEWTLDFHAVLVTPCDDCANLTDGGNGREVRGGDFAHGTAGFNTWAQLGLKPEEPLNTVGIRCARDP